MKNQLLRITVILISLSFIDGWVNNTLAQGNLEWVKQIGGTKFDLVYSIKIDSVGNVYTMGPIEDTIDMDPGPDLFNLIPFGGPWNGDIYVSKLDASGNFLWAKQLGGPYRDWANGMDVDPAGNVYLTGSFQGTADFDPGLGVFSLTTTTDDFDVFVCKLTPSGNFSWAKQFASNVPYHYSEGLDIAVDSLGNVYTTGTYSATTDFDPGVGEDSLPTTDMSSYGGDVYISKLDASGNFVWAKHIGFFPGGGGGNLAIDKAANVLISGGFSGTVDVDPGTTVYNMTSDPLVDIYGSKFILKLDLDGNFRWAKQFGGGLQVIRDIAADRLGNVYTTGGFVGTIDFNPGTLVYDLTSVGGEYDFDIFICKLDSAGNFGWARKMGGYGFEWSTGIAVDVASSVYTTGTFLDDTVDFNPRSGVYNMSATGQHAFISKLQDDGTFLWAKNIGNSSGDNTFIQLPSITVDAKANTFVGGNFYYTCDFDPGPSVFDFTSINDDIWAFSTQDIFVLKLHDTLSTVNIEEQAGQDATNFSLYPNPSNGKFSIGVTLDSDQQLTIEIIDITGQVIKTINQSKLSAGENSMAIDASALSNGIYFVKIYNDNSGNTLKFVINK